MDYIDSFGASYKPRNKRILFLSFGSPWPTHSGAALRTFGLLRQLSKSFDIELLLLTRSLLSSEQYAVLNTVAQSITQLPLRDVTKADKLNVLTRMVRRCYPYHSAVLDLSLSMYPEIRRKIDEYPGIVFTSTGHWGTLVHERMAPNWVLNQCDADVEFWRVYASQTSNQIARLAARLNYHLARRHYPRIYANVGRIISVCEEDRHYTLDLAPYAQVDVIENGVDCSYYSPGRRIHNDLPRLLFTGTSAARNITALRDFIKNVFPLIRKQMPNVELLVAGNFDRKSQAEFAGVANIHFTGRVDDIRPFFDQSNVYIAPFAETHGSKLKIAEAMAMAMPIVSTPQGVRGFALQNGESVLLARDYEQFANNVLTLLSNQALRDSIGQSARLVALSTIDWDMLGTRLVSSMNAIPLTSSDASDFGLN